LWSSSGTTALGNQTLSIDAEEDDGEVTGEVRFTDSDNDASSAVVTLGARTPTPTAWSSSAGKSRRRAIPETVGELVALFIREGDPDSVAIWLDEGENASCSELLVNRHDVLDDDSAFVDVEGDGDIETG
jgi:hypothetical protein